MSEQPREYQESAEPGDAPGSYGSLSVEDDADGTENPADLAGTANPDDADVASEPSVSEADGK